MSHAQIRAIVIGMMLATFLAALNQTIVATALPTMGRDFDDFENLSWIVTAYLLTSTAVSPLYGKFSDIYGRRAMMLTAIGIFAAGSLMCAVAPNMLVLIVGRGLQGVGGGGILPIAQSILADIIAPRVARTLAGLYGFGVGLGRRARAGARRRPVPASATGGWCSGSTCRSVLAAALMTWRRLGDLPRHARVHRLDLLGALLMMAAAIPLLLALTWGGARYAWTSPVILSLIALSGVLTVVFTWHLTRARSRFCR